MVVRWNRVATCFYGVVCASFWMLSGCSGGGGGPSSLPAQPSQQQNPGQPSAPPSATSSVRIYAVNPHLGILQVYDEDGHPIANCPFPGLSQPIQIAFDSNNQRLYITHFGAGIPVLAYDLNGNRIMTQGSFANAGPFITFDSINRRLYAFNGAGQPPLAEVFDEDGNRVTVSGMFLNSETAVTVAFDPFNRQIYVGQITGGGVVVYDEQGNNIPFPDLSACDGISALAFDPHNRRFYMAGPLTPQCGTPNVIVFDEAGNIVKTTGTFPNVVAPTAMTFDTHNNRLYVLNLTGITVYDEQGNQISTTGTFPNSTGNSTIAGIAAAPQ
jgi:DNA-binding beta-propeller fold protein YncE